MLEPRVFLCKAGRFMENIHNKHMSNPDDGPIFNRESFGSDEFANSCDIKQFQRTNTPESEESGPSQDIIESDPSSQDDGSNSQENIIVDQGEYPGGEVTEAREEIKDLPIIVFEGTTYFFSHIIILCDTYFECS